MKTKIIFALALGAAVVSPAMAQKAKPTPLQSAASAFASGDLGKAWTVGYKVPAVNEKTDPWKPVTQQQMAETSGERRNFQMAIQVDYNGDGIPDRAYMANNSQQGAVIVELGGNKGRVIAFKGIGPFKTGQELIAAGKRRIVLQFPESSHVVLTSEGGKPAVYYLGDDE